MQHIGKFELLEELGRGGFGTVYRARDTYLNVDRALKLLHPLLNSDPDFVKRFRQEAQFVARLQHPNLIPIYDLGEADGWLYLIMNYMPGGNLKTKLSQGPLHFNEALGILEQVNNGLAYVHEQGIIHRDIKPQNILFDQEGKALIGDFGFARSAEGSNTMSMTGGGLGTPMYMAPEAWKGQGWTPATDIYGLACVFVEMLTGNVLFDAQSPNQAVTMHVIEGPKFPAEWAEGVPDGVEEVLKKGLASDPENRYQDSRNFVQEIKALLDVRPDLPKPPLQKAVPTAQRATLWKEYKEGEEALKRGDYNLAVQNFSHILNITPNYYDASKQLERAKKLLAQKDIAKGKVSAVTKNPVKQTALQKPVAGNGSKNNLRRNQELQEKNPKAPEKRARRNRFIRLGCILIILALVGFFACGFIIQWYETCFIYGWCY